MRLRKVVLLLTVAAVLGGGALLFLKAAHGFSAREKPTKLEEVVARNLRRLSMPVNARRAENPVPATPDVLRQAREHFADHCVSCHGNDGSGQTTIGRGLYPKAPDMRLPATQQLTDGELFFVIENGVRFTGMPAWGTGNQAGVHDSWALVHFIRHLPKLTPEEIAQMEELNPRSRREIAEEEEEKRFLEGGSPEPARPAREKHRDPR